MRRCLPILLLLAAIRPAGAQRAFRAALGVTRSTDLVHDAVLDNSVLSLAIAPSATIGVAIPINGSGGYRFVVEGSYATSKLSATDDSHATNDLGRLATISTMLMLDGRIQGTLRWQAGGGLIFYRPTNHAGVFQDGGTRRYQVGGGLSWNRPIGAGLDLVVLGRYAFQEFTTRTLAARGYSSYQSVHRVGLQVGVERRF